MLKSPLTIQRFQDPQLFKPYKILLCIPPAYDRFFPPLATPSLCAFLKSKGISAYQMDLNIEFYKYIREHQLEFKLGNRYRKNKIKSRVYYWQDLNYEGENSGSYEFEKIPGCAFDFTEKLLSSKNLLRFTDDKKENIFYNFFMEKIFEKVLKGEFDMVGFSITAPSQVISSFTFGRIIKNKLPDINVVIGGQWVSFFRQELLKRSDFSAFYDYAVYFEGETPLYSLISSLRKSKNLKDSPNLIYKNKKSFVISKGICFEDMNKLPCPDFSGLPLKDYLSAKNEKICSLTFETSRGCYWNKCIFCVDLPVPKPKYREKGVGLLIQDIKNLKRKYKVRKLIISNATTSPRQMRRFSTELLRQKIRIKWWAWARFEKQFTKQLLNLAKKAGCVFLVFGLESINQRVLDFCEKGTRADIIERIIKDAIDLNLEIYFQVMIGLPGETTVEAMENLMFIRKFRRYFRRHTAFNVYYLIQNNRVFDNPGLFGIGFQKNLKLPFRYFYPFKYTSGDMDKDKIKKIVRSYELLMRRR